MTQKDQTVPRKTLTVYYRIGGHITFQWHRVLETYPDRDAAKAKCDELRRAGYPALYEYTHILDAVGLPETFTADQPVAAYTEL